MSNTTRCHRCGESNPLTRIFCVKCGAHLDLAEAEKILKGHRSRGHRLVRIVEIILLALIALLLWPAKPLGQAGKAADARTLGAKIGILSAAIRQGRAVAQVVTEAEINGYLAESLDRNPERRRSKGARLGLREVNVALKPGHITVVVIALWGPLKLSYEMQGRPVLTDGRFRLDVRQARWGHLPLPEPAAGWLTARLNHLFSGMENERRLLDHLSRMEVGEGRIRVATGS